MKNVCRHGNHMGRLVFFILIAVCILCAPACTMPAGPPVNTTTATPAAADTEGPACTAPPPTASPTETPYTPTPTAATPTPTATLTPGPEPTPDLPKLQKRSRELSGIIAAAEYTFALTKGGKVLQAGHNEDFGVLDTREWDNIVSLACGYTYLVGLRSDGTVSVATSRRSDIARYVEDWKNIVAVSARGNGTVMGLKADGTVVSMGIPYNSADPDKVKNWKNIVAIAAGEKFGLGLRADGTVVATGNNEYGQCDVDDWKDIVAIAANSRTVLGLKSDGSVVSAGYGNEGEREVQAWRDIVSVALGSNCAIGLLPDGTVITAGNNDLGQFATQGWTDVIAIAGGVGTTVGLQADGTAVAAGFNDYGQCEVEDWKGLATAKRKFD